ncbi:MAG: cytochrome c [Kiloniellales bacterium]|nr:cytochrome c [Kiloniellales bacterium]
MSQFPLRTMALAAILALVQAGTAYAQEGEERFAASAAEFRNSCASCHGADGKGAGFLIRIFRGVDPGDLTQLSKNNKGVFPLDRVFEVIDGRKEVAAHGERKMPVWGDRYMAQSMTRHGPGPMNDFVVRNRVLELVYYIQSIQEP